MKQKCAKAAVSLIQDGMVIGLGAGGTIAYLVEEIKAANKNVKIVTPTITTETLCVNAGLYVLPLRQVSHVDIAFDGCDEVDDKGYALKSGGSIHVKEKLIANMASEYVLLVDESKVSETLTFKVPIIIEFLSDACAYVKSCMEQLGGSFKLKEGKGKIGYMMSDDGNMLAEVCFPHVEDPKKLNEQLQQIAGIIDTSLLTKEVTQIVCASKEGIRFVNVHHE